MSIEKTLAERGDRYGSFENHANIAQALQDVMRSEAGWERLAADQRQALTVIADKIARMLNGDPAYRDNWHDIVGYAKLVDDRMAADELQREKVGCMGEEMTPEIEYAYSSISPEDYADGWRAWPGGERPGTAETKFDLRTRNGQELFGVMTGENSWRHSGHEHDIVAYREGSSIGGRVESGWTAWAGGDRPVCPGSFVELLVDGGKGKVEGYAGMFDWGRRGTRHDILAYRECKPAEPLWKHWNGAGRKFSGDTVVDLKFRNGEVKLGVRAEQYAWRWEKGEEPWDIIAYRFSPAPRT